MRRVVAAVPVLLMVLGCGSPSQQASRAKPVVSLQASLLPPTHGIGFYVNKPAYIALFNIVPGGGIGLAYPQMGREMSNRVSVGPQWVTRSVPYMPASYREPDIAGPHYLFLVASRQPLLIDDYVGYSDYLREKLGNVTYTGNAYTSMKALITEVVPSQPDEDWTTAVYIVYPSGRRGREPIIYRLVLCPGQHGFWIPIDQTFLCPPPGDSVALPKVLDENGKAAGDDPKTKRKEGVKSFDGLHTTEAAAVIRSAMQVERPPMPLAPRTESHVYSGSRSGYDGRSEPVLSGVTTSSPTSSSTTQTAAQEPSNSRGGRVAETP